MLERAAEFLKNGALEINWDNMSLPPIGKTPEGHFILFEDKEKDQRVLALAMGDGSLVGDYQVQNGSRERGFGPVVIAANLGPDSMVMGDEVTVRKGMHAGRVWADGDVTLEDGASATFVVSTPVPGTPHGEMPPPREGQKIWLGENADPGRTNLFPIADTRVKTAEQEQEAGGRNAGARSRGGQPERDGDWYAYEADVVDLGPVGPGVDGLSDAQAAKGVEELGMSLSERIAALHAQLTQGAENAAVMESARGASRLSAAGQRGTSNEDKTHNAGRTLRGAGAQRNNDDDSHPTARGSIADRLGGRQNGRDGDTPAPQRSR